jgi:hypothetical protein
MLTCTYGIEGLVCQQSLYVTNGLTVTGKHMFRDRHHVDVHGKLHQTYVRSECLPVLFTLLFHSMCPSVLFSQLHWCRDRPLLLILGKMAGICSGCWEYTEMYATSVLVLACWLHVYLLWLQRLWRVWSMDCGTWSTKCTHPPAISLSSQHRATNHCPRKNTLSCHRT